MPKLAILITCAIITTCWMFTIAGCLIAFSERQSKERYEYINRDNKVMDINDIGNFNILSNIFNCISLMMVNRKIYLYWRTNREEDTFTKLIPGTQFISVIIAVFVFWNNCHYENCFHAITPLYILLLIHIFLLWFITSIYILMRLGMCLIQLIKFCIKKYCNRQPNGIQDPLLDYEPINSSI